MMEIPIVVPNDDAIMQGLMFDTKFHNVDALVDTLKPDVLQFDQLNSFSSVIQNSVEASPTLQKYALNLWKATRQPLEYGVKVSNVDMNRLVLAGASPRGMSMMLRAARVNAWLNERTAVTPEDIHAVFHETVAHRLVFSPVYEMRRTEIAREMLSSIINAVAAP
jgi:MoxR-like ATPase